MVDLTYELVTARNKNPITFPFALLHVTFTLLSQLVGVTSRFVIATLALVPVERHGTLSGEWAGTQNAACRQGAAATRRQGSPSWHCEVSLGRSLAC